MRRRTWFVLGTLAGITVGVLGALPLSKPRGRCHGCDLVPVVVLLQDVEAGTPITMDMISQRSLPEQFVTQSYVRPDAVSSVVNQRLLVSLKSGDPLRWPDFGTDRLAVQPKTRAFTITVDAARMLNGQLARGDRVDVLATLVDPQTNERIAQTLVEHVLVLGVTATGVVVQVGSDEAEALMLAQDVGRFALALRSPEDSALQEDRGRATLATLINGQRRSVGGSQRRQAENIRALAP